MYTTNNLQKQELRHLSTLVKQIQRENAWSSHSRHVMKMKSLKSKQNINKNDATVGVDGDDNGSRRLIDGEKEKEDLRVKVRVRKSRQPIKIRRLDEDNIGAGLSPLSSVPTLQNNYNTANLMRLGQRENGNDIVDAREEAMPMNNGDAELDTFQTSESSHHQQQSRLTTILEEEKLNAKIKHEETTDSDAAGSQSQEELNQRSGLEQKPHRHNGQKGTIIENESNHYQKQILLTNQKERTLPEVGFPRRGSLRQRYSFNRRSKSGKPDYDDDDNDIDCEMRDRELGRLDGFAYWGEEDDDGVGGKSGKGDKRVTGKVGRPIARGKTGKRVGGRSGKSERCPGYDGRRTPRPTPRPSKKTNNKPKPTPPPVRPWTRRPTAPVCSPDCPDCSPNAPLKCPEQSLKAVCDPGNEEVYPRGDSRAGERIASFKDCYQMCKPSFCCIHDSLSKEVAPSCAEEYENCPMWYPCYVIWWKLHDTLLVVSFYPCAIQFSCAKMQQLNSYFVTHFLFYSL